MTWRTCLFALLVSVLVSSCSENLTSGPEDSEKAARLAEAAALERAFKTEAAALAKTDLPTRPRLVRARDEWLLVVPELKYAASGPFWGAAASHSNPAAPPDKADPIPAIVHFNQQLADHGVELLFMPIPVRSVIYPESVFQDGSVLPDEPVPHLHTPEIDFLNELRSRGVNVVELTPIFLRNRSSEPGPLFVPSDTHWTPSAVALAARTVACALASREWASPKQKLNFFEKWTIEDHFGNNFRVLREHTGEQPDPDRVITRRIKLRTPDGLERLVMKNPSSPVILMGDSNTIHWKGWNSSLAHQLAVELGFKIDVFSTTGGGANETRLNLRRRLLSEPSYLDGKKVVIWCFTALSLTNTEEGWIKIPLS